jgi:hypothetical protein
MTLLRSCAARGGREYCQYSGVSANLADFQQLRERNQQREPGSVIRERGSRSTNARGVLPRRDL